ncbi:hypothetical protein ACEPAH_4159 [Sanghuangporus vaninii]
MTERKRPERIPFSLNDGERWWRDRYDMLKEHGYQLRPRYHPEWKPSWTAKQLPGVREDSYVTYHPKVIDAIRLSDGMRVSIKKLRKGSKELEIARYLDSEELRKDPRNITVPLLDVFREEEDTMEFMVMPLLKSFDDPSFSSVDEVIDFMKQTLQGLSFMHSKGVAHRDCSVLNIMMDARKLFPRDFHPTSSCFDASGKNLARPRRRRDVTSIKYYFIDFGISSRFDDATEPRLVTGEDCQDKQLPEIYQDKPYDPFPVDIFILGNLFKHSLVELYENLEFLAPLANRMTEKDPASRPTIDEALSHFGELVKEQSPRSLRRLLVWQDADKVERFLFDMGSSKREAAFVIKSSLRRFTRSSLSYFRF